MRVLLVAAAVASVAGCKTQSLDARSRFVEDGVQVEATDEWFGERIAISNAGVTPTGGIAVTSEPARTRVHAVARLLVTADTFDKPAADAAIGAVSKTYGVTVSDPPRGPKVTSVFCGTASTAAGDPAGCDALDVSLPAGRDTQPLFLSVRSGNGAVEISLGDAVGELDLHGSHGPLGISLVPARRAVINAVADTGDDIVLRLPKDFGADLVTLTGGVIDTTAFPDVQSGKGRGLLGAGATSITLQTSGRITLLVR